MTCNGTGPSQPIAVPPLNPGEQYRVCQFHFHHPKLGQSGNEFGLARAVVNDILCKQREKTCRNNTFPPPDEPPASISYED